MLIGTAGHVDHGKTTLIRALTGVDCDRLDEEKQRGITIELGFARWALPQGPVSVIDVPGHERLVRTMLIGAGGLDAILLAVSAVSGVMPQTREHLNACRVLGIERGVVALTFADRVEDIEVAIESVRDGLVGTPLVDAPIVPVAAPTGAGIAELGVAMNAVLGTTPDRDDEAPACLPIDRVFTIGGFGTVVTGSLWRGTLRVGDQVQLCPGPERVRIRGLQVHGNAVQFATPGHRVAVNLDVPREAIERGALVTGIDSVGLARVLDVSIDWLGHNPKALGRKRGLTLHLGADRAVANVRADGVIEPGARGTARIRLDRAIPVPPGARFVLRGAQTHRFGAVVGGGRVLDPTPPRRRSADGRNTLSTSDDATAWAQMRVEAGRRGIAIEDLRRRWPNAPQRYDPFDPVRVEVEAARLLDKVVAQHTARPDLPGISPPTLATDELARTALAHAVATGRLERAHSIVRVPGHHARLENVDQGLARKIMRGVGKAGLSGLTQKAIYQRFPADDARIKTVLEHLVRQGRLIHSADLCFPAREAKLLAARAAQATLAGQQLSVAWLKDAAGVSRRQAIPLWAWLDREGVTARQGDLRVAGPRAHEFSEQT